MRGRRFYDVADLERLGGSPGLDEADQGLLGERTPASVKGPGAADPVFFPGR